MIIAGAHAPISIAGAHAPNSSAGAYAPNSSAVIAIPPPEYASLSTFHPTVEVKIRIIATMKTNVCVIECGHERSSAAAVRHFGNQCRKVSSCCKN